MTGDDWGGGRPGRINPLEVLYRAARDYVPQPYEGPVVLVRSTERTFGFAADPKLGWDDQLIPAMKIRKVPGNHYTIYMPPNVESLAGEMNACLKAAEKEWS